MKGDGWDATGVYLSNAERFFFDCCATSVKRIDEISKEYEGKDPESGYYETIEKTKVAIQELRPLVNEWISLMDKVDEELTHDGSRHSVERAASYMLMKWASSRYVSRWCSHIERIKPYKDESSILHSRDVSRWLRSNNMIKTTSPTRNVHESSSLGAGGSCSVGR